MSLVILTGASGAGKTTIAREFLRRYPAFAETCHFDSVGVPALDDMVSQFGSGEEWQRAKTIEWMGEISRRVSRGPILLEGQMRLEFIREAARAAKIPNYIIVLIDCDDATRLRRLAEQRRQPDLASDQMMNWARYLREEAQYGGDKILDTSVITVAEAVDIVRRYFD